MQKLRQTLSHLYMGAFLIYLIIPLVIMAGAAFNDSKLPSVVPWKGFTLRWFHDLFQDERMWIALANTMLVALAANFGLRRAHGAEAGAKILEQGGNAIDAAVSALSRPCACQTDSGVSTMKVEVSSSNL